MRGHSISDFYCTVCANKQMLSRKKSKKKEKGHLKKLHCFKCKEELNHYEVREFDYDFDIEEFKNQIANGEFPREKE